MENIYNQQNNFNIISSEFAAIKKWGYKAIPTKQKSSEWIKIKESSSSKVENIKGLKKILRDELQTKKPNTALLDKSILLHS